MGEFKLKPGDILVNVNDKKDPWSVIRRWAVGPYSHVSLYLGQMGFFFDRRQGRIQRFPMIFESNGRGCCLRLLSERYGEEVVVMRLKYIISRRRIPYIISESLNLASDPQSHYDYYCIIRFVLLRIICEKLHLPIPLAWHRDERQICSEAVYEVFYRGVLEGILPPDKVPLPGDFVTDSPLLEMEDCVILSQELV
jgi:hypothetical protein